MDSSILKYPAHEITLMVNIQMKKRIIIIGAVALGPKVAARLRRLDANTQITVIDRDNLISYGGCGIPYYIGGDIADIEGLCSTSFHVLRDPDYFKTCKGIEVLPRVEAISINREKKSLEIFHLDKKEKDTLKYDKLVIATGATPFIPPIPGSDLDFVHVVSNLHNAREIKDKISKGMVENAVVIGAGAIGIEIAEAMTDLWGINTTIIEKENQILPGSLDINMSKIVENHLIKKDVAIKLSEHVEYIADKSTTGKAFVKTGSGEFPCDIVVLSAGIRPNTEFASESGLAVGSSGGLLVDRCMRTTDPDIYAGGDCVELRNLVSGENMTMPLGSLANRQGRVIANNIYGKATKFRGVVGTFCIKIFDMGIATAGLTIKQAKANGFEPVYSIAAQPDRAHFYPSAKMMYIKLIADRKTRKILGIQAVGEHGDGIKARVDSVAPLLHTGVDIDDICVLETGYAPPYSSAMDIINNAGNILDNILDKRNNPMDALEFITKFRAKEILAIDVRDAAEAQICTEKYPERWLNIPHPKILNRIDEIPREDPICLVCGTGTRSYECQVLLNQKGFTNICNVQGGYTTLVAVDPELF